jgi:hypothetical protein
LVGQVDRIPHAAAAILYEEKSCAASLNPISRHLGTGHLSGTVVIMAQRGQYFL